MDSDNEDALTDEHFSLNTDTVFEILEPGTFIGMRSPHNAIEPFFLGEVIDKGIAEDNFRDDGGHMIMTGRKYARVSYLQKSKEGKKKVTYERPRKQNQEVFIYIDETIFQNIYY